MAHACEHLVDCLEPLRRHITTGESMRLALVCRTLYLQILGYLRNRIYELIRLPLRNQPIYYMQCFHRCDEDRSTAFVCRLGRTTVDVRCTHCLYCARISYQNLPPSTWQLTPPHDQWVQQILQRTGARHTLLPPSNVF